jgi:hypothetical protein
MKKVFIAAIAILALGVTAHAQTTHKVTLSWTASSDSTTATPGTVSVLRASGVCPATGVPATVTTLTTSAPAGGPYVDSTVTAGQYCYYVTATIGGATSVPSNTSGAPVPTFPPSGLTVVVQ